MPTIAFLVLWSLARAVPPAAEEHSYTPLNYTNQVGMWLPYVKFPEIMQGKSEEARNSAKKCIQLYPTEFPFLEDIEAYL